MFTEERIFQVGSNVLGDLGWINNDSFAIAPNGQGGTSIFNTLGTTDARNYKGSYWFVGGGGPYAATGTYAPISIDLENNLIAFIAPSFAGLTSITSAFEASLPIPAWMGDTQPNFQPVHSRVRSLLEKSHKLASLRLPSKNWEAEEGVKFTNLTINEYVSESNDPNSYRKSLLVQPIPQNDQTDLGIVSEKNANASLARWRGIGVTGTQIISDTSLNNRLKDFGINILDGIDPHEKIAKIKEINDQTFYGFGSLPNIKIASDFNCWTEAVSISETICIGFQNVRGMMWSLGERSIALFAGNVDGGNRAFLNPRVYLYDSTANTKLVDLINVIPDASSTGPYCSSKLLACQFAGHIVADRWLVLWSTESRASAIYDLKNQKLVSSFAFMEKGELIDKIHMMEDEKHVLQMNQDGSFFIYNIGSQKRIILGRYEDDEIIVWSPDGHYDATAEGAHFVNVRFSGKAGQFTFEQFERQLRVPDLLAKILNNEPIQKNSIDDVGVPPELAVSLTQKEKRIRGQASFASENPLVQINLYQDGLLTDRIDVANNVSSVPIDVAHADGARWISLLAVDNKGLISQPAGLMIANNINTKSRIHLLAVGINKYTQPSLTDLKYARNDAQAIKNTLENLPSVEAGKLLSITDELNPTPSTILSNAEAIVDQAEIGDTLIFSFSGHGLRDDDGQFYLATPQTDAGKISQTALPWAKLGKIFSKSKARVIVFLDACRSGLADDNLFASNDDAAATLLDKVTSGISVISASKGRELAFEHADLRGGIFTNALIEVIHGSRNRYDTNKNGAIEISELYRGIKELVVLRSNAEQTPWLTRNQMVGNFAIF